MPGILLQSGNKMVNCSFFWSKTYASVMSIETPTQGQEPSASHPPAFCEQAVTWRVIQGLTFCTGGWSYLANCNKLSEGKEGNLSLARNPCKFGGGGKKKSPHNLLPLLFSPCSPTHPGSIPSSDLKLDCKDCIHPTLVQTVSLPLPSNIQPYYLDLFCALKNNFRNKM